MLVSKPEGALRHWCGTSMVAHVSSNWMKYSFAGVYVEVLFMEDQRFNWLIQL